MKCTKAKQVLLYFTAISEDKALGRDSLQRCSMTKLNGLCHLFISMILASSFISVW